MEVQLRLEMKNPAEIRRVASVRMEGLGEDATGFPIGVVADLLSVTEQSLRLYESRGLVKPARRYWERYHRTGDVRWLEFLRHPLHTKKVSIEGVRRLFRFAPCWGIVGFPQEARYAQCPVFRDHRDGPVTND